MTCSLVEVQQRRKNLLCLGRKERAALSSKTNGARIDAARERLLAQMAALMAGPT